MRVIFSRDLLRGHGHPGLELVHGAHLVAEPVVDDGDLAGLPLLRGQRARPALGQSVQQVVVEELVVGVPREVGVEVAVVVEVELGDRLELLAPQPGPAFLRAAVREEVLERDVVGHVEDVGVERAVVQHVEALGGEVGEVGVGEPAAALPRRA